MDAFQCAVVRTKLERFEWEVQQRQRIARRYHYALNERLEALESI